MSLNDALLQFWTRLNPFQHEFKPLLFQIYTSVIEENSRSLRTDIILQVNGEFNLLAYSEYVILDQSMREFISINDNTGEVMLRRTIDYEQTQVLSTIIAIKGMLFQHHCLLLYLGRCYELRYLSRFYRGDWPKLVREFFALNWYFSQI